MKCMKCGTENPDGGMFCSNCGEELYTGENVSGSIDQVHKSNMEMVDLLKEYCHNVNVDLLKRTITYKYDMKKQGKLVPSIKNIDLFLYNTIYQLLWKGM